TFWFSPVSALKCELFPLFGLPTRAIWRLFFFTAVCRENGARDLARQNYMEPWAGVYEMRKAGSRKQASAGVRQGKAGSLSAEGVQSSEDNQLAVFVKWQNRSDIGCKTIPDILFQPITHEAVIMRGIFGLHKAKKIIPAILVDGLGNPGGVAVEGKMFFDLVDHRSRKKHVFEIHPVLPGGTSQHNRLILSYKIVANGFEIRERSGDDLAGAPVQRHMQELGTVGCRQYQRPAADEFAGIFKRGIAMLQTLGDHPVPLACRDPVDLSAELDTLGDAVYGDNTFCSVIKGGSDGGGGSENIDDHYNGMVYIIQMQQGRGQSRM